MEYVLISGFLKKWKIQKQNTRTVNINNTFIHAWLTLTIQSYTVTNHCTSIHLIAHTQTKYCQLQIWVGLVRELKKKLKKKCPEKAAVTHKKATFNSGVCPIAANFANCCKMPPSSTVSTERFTHHSFLLTPQFFYSIYVHIRVIWELLVASIFFPHLDAIQITGWHYLSS